MMGNKKDRTRTMSVKKQCVLDTPPAMQPKPNGLTTLKKHSLLWGRGGDGGGEGVL